MVNPIEELFISDLPLGKGDILPSSPALPLFLAESVSLHCSTQVSKLSQAVPRAKVWKGFASGHRHAGVFGR